MIFFQVVTQTEPDQGHEPVEEHIAFFGPDDRVGAMERVDCNPLPYGRQMVVYECRFCFGLDEDRREIYRRSS